MAVTSDEALVGRVLNDRYLIGARIARGGMASVFRATDQRLDREVAIKVMHHGLGDDQQFTQRFVREAQSAAKLNHRSVVSVFDQGMDGEVTYLVMEYVPGHTLRDVMREESPMAPYRALELLEQVLIALSAAHAAHIIHRDVKPENVLITPDGDVKVADFGLARAVSAATTATGGTLIGTVSYLAPEIVVNEGADARSDVYACGAMLYEMLTGTKPHSGESPIQVAYKHVHEDIGPPSDVQAGIPPYVDALVARATVRDRDRRSTDARVLLQQLRSVQRALEAGVADDPDLVADLMPGGRATDDSDAAPTVAVAVARTSSRASAADSVATEAVAVPDETVQWSDASLSRSEAHPGPQPQPTGLHPAVSAEAYKQARSTQTRSKRGRNLLVLVILLAVAAAGLGYYYNVGRYDDAPALNGKSETEAKDLADKAGFTVRVASREFSEDVPNGVVASTDPGPGDRILPGATIAMVVSKGKDRVTIPDELEGTSVTQAKAALAKVDLVIGEKTKKFDEEVAEGDVVGAVDYSATDPLKRGTQVDLYVSDGRKPIAVDNYEGRPVAEAKTALEKAGFQVVTTEKFSTKIDKSSVISQSPNGGEKFRNDTISLVVSKGPKLVKVPDVVERPRPEAVSILEKAGFKVQSFGVGDYVVKSQSPDEGSKRAKGSTVTITQIPF